MPATDDRDAAFRAHVERVQGEFRDLKLSEADTRSNLIDPVLSLLGYQGVSHLRREVPIRETKELVDYVLLLDGKPHAIVEAKRKQHALTAQHAAQCVQYAAVLGVRWCLTTNGVVWELYDAHAKGPLAEKQVTTVRLDGDAASTEHAWAVLSVFSHAAAAAASPLSTLLIARVLTDELASPDSQAVAALRRALQRRFGERVTGAAIVAGIDQWRARAAVPDTETVSSPSVGRTTPALPPTPRARHDGAGAGRRARIEEIFAGRKFAYVRAGTAPAGVKSATGARLKRYHVIKDTSNGVEITVGKGELAKYARGVDGDALTIPATPRGGAGQRVTIRDLVEAGLLPPDAALKANVRGVSHVARVRDGMIDLDGRQFASPSAASQALRGTESWNGWVDWQHKGERLADLRDRFRSAARREQLPKS